MCVYIFQARTLSLNRCLSRSHSLSQSLSRSLHESFPLLLALYLTPEISHPSRVLCLTLSLAHSHAFAFPLALVHFAAKEASLAATPTQLEPSSLGISLALSPALSRSLSRSLSCSLSRSVPRSLSRNTCCCNACKIGVLLSQVFAYIRLHRAREEGLEREGRRKGGR